MEVERVETLEGVEALGPFEHLQAAIEQLEKDRETKRPTGAPGNLGRTFFQAEGALG